MNFETNMNHNEAEYQKEKMRKVFDGQMELVENFLENEELLASNLKHNLEGKTFQKEGKCVVCMDEGTANIPMDSKLCLAGSGVLLYSDLPREVRLEKVADLLIKHGCEEVTSHDGCGAADIAARREGWEGHPDELGKKWSKDLQMAMNRKIGTKKESRHIAAEEMVGVLEKVVEEGVEKKIRPFHIAPGIWFINCHGRHINPDKLIGAPSQFVIDGGLSEDPVYSQAEIEVAIKIAFGHHGFSELLNPDKPFVINVVADNENDLQNAKNQTFQTLIKFDQARRDCIKINGVILPEHSKKIHKVSLETTSQRVGLETTSQL